MRWWRKKKLQAGRADGKYLFLLWHYPIEKLFFDWIIVSHLWSQKEEKISTIFPEISSFLFVFLHALSFYFFPANIYLATSHITLDFFPLQNIPCEAIIFDLLRSPKLYFCSFLLLMPCHTVRNNKLAFTSCSLTLSIAAKNFLQRENCEEGEGELCGSMASQ